MAIKLRPRVNLGKILSISLSASASENPAQLRVTYLNDGNSLSAPPNTVKYGGLTFRGILVSESTHYEQGRNIITREWMDNSVTLDQNCIVLYRAGLGGTLGSTSTSSKGFIIPTINVTRQPNGAYKYDYGSTAYRAVVARLSATAGGNIIGDESWGSNKCIRSEVTYSPNAALSLMSAPAVNEGNYRCSYEGTYRSVLSSVYGDFGCSYWWDWTNDQINKIDSSSGPAGNLESWGFSNLTKNCGVLSYDIGSSRVGVSTRSNWLCKKDEVNFPKRSQEIGVSSAAAAKAFYNNYAKSQVSQGQNESVSSYNANYNYTLPSYTFIEENNTFKIYNSFTVSPSTGPFWPSVQTTLYGTLDALRLHDCIESTNLLGLGFGQVGVFNIPDEQTLETAKGWFQDSLNFDGARGIRDQIYELLGIDGRYTIYAAYELDGAPDSTGEYELYYPYVGVSNSAGKSSKWYFKTTRTQYNPESQMRGNDRCGDTWQDEAGVIQIGIWRNPQVVVEGSLENPAWEAATAGCVQQVSNTEILVNIMRIVDNLISQSNASGSVVGTGSNFISDTSTAPGSKYVNGTIGGWSNAGRPAFENADELAEAIEDGLVFIAIRNVNSSIGVTSSRGVNCADLPETAGYRDPNELVGAETEVELEEFERTTVTQTFFNPGTYYLRNPSYRQISLFNKNYGLTSNTGGSDQSQACENYQSEVPSIIDSSITNGQEFIPVVSETTVQPQERIEKISQSYEEIGEPQDPGLLGAVGTMYIISTAGAQITLTFPTFSSYRVTTVTDVQEVRREEIGVQIDAEVVQRPDQPDPNSPEEEAGAEEELDEGNVDNLSKERSNQWFKEGGISNNAGLSHSVVITDISNLEDYQGVPGSMTTPTSWLQTASAETDGFYFNVAPGLQSLSASFSSDGLLRVSYNYKQIPQKPALTRPASNFLNSTYTDIYI